MSITGWYRSMKSAGDPDRFGTRPEAIHAYNQERQAKWPYALSPLSTHDTKRSEDVRARINVLSEIPDEWSAAVRRWRRMNARTGGRSKIKSVPDANEEYLLYQTLVGAWPLQTWLGRKRIPSSWSESRPTWSRHFMRRRCIRPGSIPTPSTTRRFRNLLRAILDETNNWLSWMTSGHFSGGSVI